MKAFSHSAEGILLKSEVQDGTEQLLKHLVAVYTGDIMFDDCRESVAIQLSLPRCGQAGGK